MAKRASKSKPAKAKKAPEANPIADRIAKMISRGDMSAAAAEVASAKLSEAEFDGIMEAHPGLRDVYNRL